MTRFLRFVKSAHFFAIAFTCVFGVFLTANAFALTCTDNKVAVRNSSNTPGSETCVGIHSVPYGWTLDCGNGSRGLDSCQIYKTVEAPGCTSTHGDNYVREYKKLTKKNYGSGGYYDPNWNVYYDPYYQNDSDWVHYSWSAHEAMPGHVVPPLASSNASTLCPKCTGHGYSLGGDEYYAAYCLPCPWYGGVDTTDEFTRGFGSGAVQGTSSDDGTYCIISGTVNPDDGKGAYVEGSCVYHEDWSSYYVQLSQWNVEENRAAEALCTAMAGGNATAGNCREDLEDAFPDTMIYSEPDYLPYILEEYAGSNIPMCGPTGNCWDSYLNGCVHMYQGTLGCIQAMLRTYENVGGDVLDELVLDYYVD